MEFIDLHVHSNKSDGSFSPAELVAYACEKGLTAFALTDHDTIDGIAEAKQAAAAASVEVISGVELSTEYMGRDIHILGLYIDEENPEFLAHLEQFKESRLLRNRKMCRALSDTLGIELTFEQLQAEYPESVITRAHYAKYLLKEGHIKSMKEAFERYIGDHAPCFIPREKVTPAQGVQLIKNAGGIPVLAHPVLYGMSKTALSALIAELKASGLAGIEAVYSTYTPSDERDMKQLAREYGLLITGGSDFHGTTKKDIDLATGRGHLFIPITILNDLKQYQQK